MSETTPLDHDAYERDLTLDEVAEELSVHLNTVKGRHKKALSKLRAFFVRQESSIDL